MLRPAACSISLFMLASCTPGAPTRVDTAPPTPPMMEDPIEDPDPPELEPGYYELVKPIVDAKCVRCHTDDGIGPFPLTTYDEVFAAGPAVKVAVGSGAMPPWPPAADCSEYRADRSLSAEQVRTIVDWVDAGAPPGDPNREATPLADPDRGLSRVDASLDMPQAYTPQLAPDDYRCFVIDWPSADASFVTGFQVRPGQPSMVHHVIAFLAGPADADSYERMDAAEDGPGYTCFGGPGGNATGSIGAWAPGGLGTDYPAGTGILVRPGSKIILQVHYNVRDAAPMADLTSIDVSLAPTVDRAGVFMAVTNPQWLGGAMRIPAGVPDTTHRFTIDPTPYMDFILPGSPVPSNQPFAIHSANLHMHQLGVSAILHVDRQPGDTTCLLEIDDWDFNWQADYWLAEPEIFRPGDQLTIECRWDNTVENQPGGETPRDRFWGEGTRDEMCLGGMYITQP